MFLAVPALAAAGEPVTIDLGEPSVWSLEQAHYLLSRMRAENQGLRTKMPDQDDLDLNAIHSARIRAFQSMLEVAAEFNQADAVTGPLRAREFEAVVGRRVEIRERLNRLREARLRATTGLARDRAALQALPAGDPSRAALEARIRSQEVEKAGLEQEIGLLETELSGLETSPTDPTATSPPSGGGNNLSSGTGLVDSLLGTDFNPGQGFGNPKLHASNVLDNFIQMQYEIIAKQVSLLRDEVGPNQRLLFLELPHSIYSVPGKGEKYLARAEWQVERVCRLPETYRLAVENAFRDARDGNTYSFQMPPLDAGSIDTICENGKEWRPERVAKKAELRAIREQEEQKALEKIQSWVQQYRAKRAARPEQIAAQEDSRLWHEIATDLARKYPSLWDPVADSSTRTVDLIPRQSALNVNEIHKSTKGFAFTAKFLSVFGFGGSGGYQRQKENFDQFVHQDVFASAFGKGTPTFGWTFGPLPGTRRIAPGVRNTFAVLTVPRDAIALEIVPRGCGHRMKKHPDDVCGPASASFVVPLPTGNEGFYLTEIAYTPVLSGERVVVELEGTYFSPQIGVLVNGVPLERTVAIARPELGPRGLERSPGAGDAGVDGHYEVVNTRKVKLAFAMPDGYEGTPILSLVTPEKASPINYYKLRINRRSTSTSLQALADTEPMFRAPLALESLTVKSFTGGQVVADLAGRGFRPGADVHVNGAVATRVLCSTGLYEITFPFAPSDAWEVRLAQSTRQGREAVTETFPNGVTPSLSGYEILDFKTPGNGKAGDGWLAARLDLAGYLASDPALAVRNPRTADRVRCDSTVPDRPSSAPLECRRLSNDQLWVRIAGESPALLELLWPPWGGGQGATYSTIVTIARPDEPDIRKIFRDGSSEASGVPEGGYQVILSGNSLDSVRRVFFGSKEARIVRATPTRLVVVAPAHDEGTVHVELETDLRFRGRRVTNASDTLAETAFTYKKPPAKS